MSRWCLLAVWDGPSLAGCCSLLTAAHHVITVATEVRRAEYSAQNQSLRTETVGSFVDFDFDY